MRVFAALTPLVLAIGLMIFVTEQDLSASDGNKPDEVQYVVAYKVSDLPVWTSEKKFDPSLLVRLIQTSVSPSDWKSETKDSHMVPHPENESLVISTSRKNHEKIVDLLESMRLKK